MFKSYEHAKDEVEKLRLELYPLLYSGGEPTDGLETIQEDGFEQTDTNNEFTEDTSEAFGSDDEVRGENLDEDGDDNNNFHQDADGDEYADEVCPKKPKKNWN